MRVNVYAEELTDRIEIIEQVVNGRQLVGLRFYLELPVTLHTKTTAGVSHDIRGPFIHHAGDDDSAAVTFWSDGDLRPMMRKVLKVLDDHHIFGSAASSPKKVPSATSKPTARRP